MRHERLVRSESANACPRKSKFAGPAAVVEGQRRPVTFPEPGGKATRPARIGRVGSSEVRGVRGICAMRIISTVATIVVLMMAGAGCGDDGTSG
jgi:hypothetical protein